MAKNQNTFAKRQREMEKRHRAAEKRQRRQQRKEPLPEPTMRAEVATDEDDAEKESM